MAVYQSIGRISNMSEVQSGTTMKGSTWQRMTLTLEIPGFNGTYTTQVFQVFGDVVDDVLSFSPGDKVVVKFTLYAREWNGKMFNNVDLIDIDYQESAKQEQIAEGRANRQRRESAQAQVPNTEVPYEQPSEENNDPSNDLPF